MEPELPQDPEYRPSTPDERIFSDYCKKWFPFANVPGRFSTALWAKSLLKEMHNLSNVPEALKILNDRKIRKNGRPVLSEIFLQDLTLISYAEVEWTKLLRDNADQGYREYQVQPDDAPGYPLKVFKEITIEQLKRYLLHKTPRPFLLEHKCKNTDKVTDYMSTNGLQRLNVFYDCVNFPLRIKMKGSQTGIDVGPFTESTKIQVIMQAVKAKLNNPRETQNLKLFKGDDNPLGINDTCKNLDIYRHSELEYANLVVFVIIKESEDADTPQIKEVIEIGALKVHKALVLSRLKGQIGRQQAKFELRLAVGQDPSKEEEQFFYFGAVIVATPPNLAAQPSAASGNDLEANDAGFVCQVQFPEHLPQGTVDLIFREDSTILLVKQKVLADYGIPVACQNYNTEDGKELVDASVLGDYQEFYDGAPCSKLAVDLTLKNCVYINVFNEKKIFIEVEPGAKISDLKAKLTHKHLDVDACDLVDFKEKLYFTVAGKTQFDNQLLDEEHFEGEIICHLTLVKQNADQYVNFDKQVAVNYMGHLNSFDEYKQVITAKDIAEELGAIDDNGKKSRPIVADFEKLVQSEDKDDREMNSRLAFKYLCKAYTGGIYTQIGECYRGGMFTKLPHYNTAMIRLLDKYGKDHAYEKDDKLVYRGLRCDATADYKKHSIGYWPAMTSTSQKKSVAKHFRGSTEIAGTIFEIYLSKQNEPRTKVVCQKDWSFVPAEAEVLLLQNFCYQVVDVRQDPGEAKTKIVTLVEIPEQNLLKRRPITNTQVIWLDVNLDTAENQQYKAEFEAKFESIGFSCFDNVEDTVEAVRNTVKTVIVVAGSIAESLVPKIHHLDTVEEIVIFCGNVDHHKGWSAAFGDKKLKLVTSNFPEAMAQAQTSLSKVMRKRTEPPKGVAASVAKTLSWFKFWA